MFGKIFLILVIVFVVVFVASLIFGSKGDEAAANGCMGSLGCGYSIIQIIISVAIFALFISFVAWLFD